MIMKVSLALCLAQNEHQPNLFASTITKADLKGLKISFKTTIISGTSIFLVVMPTLQTL